MATCQSCGKGNSISAIALSPDFEQEPSLLAASLEGGILRSEDAGQTWHGSNFGLQNFEVTGLLWINSSEVLAATASGIIRSPNAGRAWRSVDTTLGMPIAAMVMLPDGAVLAATDDGLLLHSRDGGVRWQSQDSDLPADTVPTAFYASKKVLLLGTASGGLFRSLDCGRQWTQQVERPIFSLDESGVYAATGTGLIASYDDGETWDELPFSPLHDLRRIHVVQGRVIVSGAYSVTLRYHGDGFWEALTSVPLPLSLLKPDRQGRLFASGPDGLFLSEDAGEHWQQVLPAQTGHLGQLTLREDGKGWAASIDSTRMLRSSDSGWNWEIAASPLGVDAIVALETKSDLVFAATYSPTQQIARLWYSDDGGVKWNRGAEARTIWPLVATYHQPPMIALGGIILAQQKDSTWVAAQMPGDPVLAVRRIIGHEGVVLALTTIGVLVSLDQAASFKQLDLQDLEVDQIMDITLDGDRLYTLSVDGLVCLFELDYGITS